MNAPPATVTLCVVLILAFCLVRYGPNAIQEWAFYRLAFFSDDFAAALRLGEVGAGDLLRLVSHGFLHFDWLHVLMNSGFLLAFGSLVERVIGAGWFLLLFALAAAAGALTQMAFTPFGEGGPMIGASGAVYGCLGAAVPFLYARHGLGGAGLGGEGRGEADRRGIATPMRRGLNFVVVIMLINVGIAWANEVWGLFGASIAWEAHMGGFFAGLIFGFVAKHLMLRRRGPPASH